MNRKIIPFLAIIALPHIAHAEFRSGYLSDKDGTAVVSPDGTCRGEMGVRKNLDDDRCKAYLPNIGAVSEDDVREAEAPKTKIESIKTRNIKGYATFHLGNERLTEQGERTLEKAKEFTEGMEIDKSDFSGHADRLGGKSKKNDTLSGRRAETVRKSLVGDQGDSLVESHGNSESIAGACKRMSYGKTVKCLEADRRTDFDVSGTIRGN